MQLALRPYATAGVALVGASLIAVTPVTAPSPGVPHVYLPAVQLTAGPIVLPDPLSGIESVLNSDFSTLESDVTHGFSTLESDLTSDLSGLGLSGLDSQLVNGLSTLESDVTNGFSTLSTTLSEDLIGSPSDPVDSNSLADWLVRIHYDLIGTPGGGDPGIEGVLTLFEQNTDNQLQFIITELANISNMLTTI